MTQTARIRLRSIPAIALLIGAALPCIVVAASNPSGNGEGVSAPTSTSVRGGGERVAPQTGSRLRPGFGTGARLGSGFGTGSRLGVQPAQRQPVIPGPGDLGASIGDPPFVHPAVQKDRSGRRIGGRLPAPYWPHSNVYFGTGRHGLGIYDWRLYGYPTEAVFGPIEHLDPRLGFGAGPETPEGVGSLDFFSDEPERAAQPAPEPPAPSVVMAREGVEALRVRSYDAAAGVYALLVAIEPDEPEHRRRLALSLLGAGMVGDAAAAMHRAHVDAPELAWRPLDAPGLLGGNAETRRLLNRAVALANSAGAADANFLAAVLMQSEGREAPALRMLERAETAGLDEHVVAAMRLSLGG